MPLHAQAMNPSARSSYALKYHWLKAVELHNLMSGVSMAQFLLFDFCLGVGWVFFFFWQTIWNSLGYGRESSLGFQVSKCSAALGTGFAGYGAV